MPSSDRVVALPSNEVHVWRVELEPDTLLAGHGWDLLSPDERARADRFRLAPDRRRFIAGRSAVRTVLSAYVNQSGRSLRFRYGPTGKPALMLAGVEAAPCFNLSHSGRVAILAVARRPVGVDIEEVRPLPDAYTVARRFFSSAEQEALSAVPAADWLRGFFSCWTRKEAFIKGTGDGFSRPLESFDVSLLPDPRCVRIVSDPVLGASWSVRELPVDGGYVASLAVAGPLDCRVLVRRWDSAAIATSHANSCQLVTTC